MPLNLPVQGLVFEDLTFFAPHGCLETIFDKPLTEPFNRPDSHMIRVTYVSISPTLLPMFIRR
jgi:hypothetical protein